jgi:hypothetical protein
VGRPPQELRRGWGRPPICKASKLDHGLGIGATRNLAKEGKKGSMVGVEEDLRRVERREPELSVLRED